ncbi:cytochrome P450 4g15-like [Nylanderia fulva]|uniref:cytochrome P450 4g15-like n=1 Tax=Nylanderia fulva TaxID=613905 RepID=UPI0010FB8BC6|nr:cytochrome P450 4g15-like [Nylanderia fulva]XP_029158578.1 cytochrome P450 4g15-like [Nylanderia fulva]XP_029173664.1 cytochrome P450 4g15-like [Nylanderia fulva]
MGTTTLYFNDTTYWLLTALAVTLIALYYFIEHSRAVRLIKKMPGPPSLPIIGHLLIPLAKSPEDMFNTTLKYRDIYGLAAGVYIGHRVAVFLADPQDIEIILSNPAHNEKAVEYEFFEPWLGDGLLITKGDKWHRHRKIIAPTFHMSILKTFVPLFYENSIDLVRRLRNEVGKEFDCHDYLSAVTVDILTETAMGVKREKRKNTGYDYAMAVMKMSDIVHRRHYNVILRSELLFKLTKFARKQEKMLNIIHTLINHVIKEKSKDIEDKNQQQKEVQNENNKLVESVNAIKNEGNDQNNDAKYKLHYVRDDLDDIDENDINEKKRLAFLDTMMELKNVGQMTDEEIWEEVNTIMFEGHDTTAAGSSFALCALGCHQDIQARVHEELDAIFGDSDRQCTFQDTLEMKYLERVILETLRLFPPVPIIARKLNEEVKIVTGDYILPKGATAIIAQFAAHRSDKYYPNPTVFNPDNFLPEKMQKRHYYAFIPFSAGPRSCVGRKYAMLKLKVLLSTILRNYRVISDVPEKDFVLRADIILKRHDGFKIKIEPRKPVSLI